MLDIPAGTLKLRVTVRCCFLWLVTVTAPGKGNIDAGAALVGQINVGAWRIDINGNELASMTTTALFPPGSWNVAGAESLVRLGD